MFEREGFKFDFPTRRFIENRWETDVGRKVRDEVIRGLKNSLEIRAILDEYTLEHPENFDPYGHPIYPVEAIKEKKFWVLTQDDLRGIHIYHEDFSYSQSFEKKSLSYSHFFKCKFNDAEFVVPDVSYARFEDCEFLDAIMVGTGGFSTNFINCNLQNACFWKAQFIDSGFSGSNLRGVYFEDAFLLDIHLNYLTQFDKNLTSQWKTRTLPPNQRAEILRNIRIGYEKADLWHIADRFLYCERTENRKNAIWSLCVKSPNPPNIWSWTKDFLFSLISGYGTKPHRAIILGLLISIFFALLYFLLGTPSDLSDLQPRLYEALYFSFTTFATLGYGDISYGSDREIMRLLSTSEAWIGAVTISFFVAVLARKLLR